MKTASGFFFSLVGDITLKCCHSNGTTCNNVDALFPSSGSYGILVNLCGDCYFDRCITNNQMSQASGPNLGFNPLSSGIDIRSSGNVTLISCQTNESLAGVFVGNLGRAFGILTGVVGSTVLQDCSCNGQTGTSAASGFLMSLITGGLVMKCCRATDTQVTLNSAFICNGIFATGVFNNSCFWPGRDNDTSC